MAPVFVTRLLLKETTKITVLKNQIFFFLLVNTPWKKEKMELCYCFL